MNSRHLNSAARCVAASRVSTDGKKEVRCPAGRYCVSVGGGGGDIKLEIQSSCLLIRELSCLNVMMNGYSKTGCVCVCVW